MAIGSVSNAPAAEGYALSPQQRRLWSLLPRGAAPVAQIAASIQGHIVPRALKQAFQTVVLRHDILRARFERLPGLEFPVQVAVPDACCAIEEIDIAQAAENLRREAIGHHLALMRSRADSQPDSALLQLALLHEGDQRATLLATLPSLCADPGTLIRLLREAAQLYAGVELSEPILYTQFAAWQNELLDDAAAQIGRAHV